jgi:hypothetical protein
MSPTPETSRLLPAPPPRFLAALALALRRWLIRLANRVVPPQFVLFEQIAGVGATQCLHAAARLRIADLLAGGPLTAAELAARTGADRDSLHRLLRGLATFGVFALDPDGRFRNSRLSIPLQARSGGSLRDYAEYFGSASNLRAWADVDATLESGRNAFERVHGMTVWQWFDAHPEEREVFAGAMVALTRLSAAAIATAYPFAEVERICDVGGGSGTLLAEVLLRHSGPRGVLFDGAGVLATAGPFLAGRGLSERVELAAGSFFDRVPEGCDAYLLKNILHDWDDERSLAILRNCRQAMRAGSRLLVVEALVETFSTTGMGPLTDLQMMVACCEGRERSRAEYERLLAAAGFHLARIVPTPGPMSIVEGRAV